MKRSKLLARESGRPWQPLVQGRTIPPTPKEYAARVAHSCELFPHIPRDVIVAQIDEVLKDEIWRNDRYQVNMRRYDGDPPIVHLSIKTIDRKPVRDWRDCQRIKNQLVGPECEGIELYPAESRLIDTANSYHLWVVDDPTFRFPFGWTAGRAVDGRSRAGAIQRPLDDDYVC